jgi:hypothetical protein
MDDRPCEQVRKEGDEEGVVDETIFLSVSFIGIDEVGNLGEGEEADAYRKDNVQQREIENGERIEARNEEIHIFEVNEETQVTDDPDDEEGTVFSEFQ